MDEKHETTIGLRVPVVAEIDRRRRGNFGVTKSARPSSANESDRDPKTGRFITGNNGGPGRPKGSKNYFQTQFWDDLADIWERGGAEALQKVFDNDPTAFLRVAASMMPKDNEHKHTGPVHLITWRDRELASHMSHGLGSRDSTTEQNELPSAASRTARAQSTDAEIHSAFQPCKPMKCLADI